MGHPRNTRKCIRVSSCVNAPSFALKARSSWSCTCVLIRSLAQANRQQRPSSQIPLVLRFFFILLRFLYLIFFITPPRIFICICLLVTLFLVYVCVCEWKFFFKFSPFSFVKLIFIEPPLLSISPSLFCSPNFFLVLPLVFTFFGSLFEKCL